jgi:Family of unknown function (DUF5771)
MPPTIKKAPVRIPVKRRGDLRKLGYAADKSAKARKTALKKAVQLYGKLAVFRKLLAVSTLLKSRNPHASETFRQNAKWVFYNA